MLLLLHHLHKTKKKKKKKKKKKLKYRWPQLLKVSAVVSDEDIGSIGKYIMEDVREKKQLASNVWITVFSYRLQKKDVRSYELCMP
ncbi:unnamed protein product [Arabidopsis halleri]